MEPLNIAKHDRQCIKFQSSDGKQFRVDNELVGMCPTAKHVLGGKRTSFRNTLGGSTFAIEGSHVLLKREGRVLATLLSDTPEEAIVHLPEVKADALGRVIDYCRHAIEVSHHPDLEKRAWDIEYAELDQSALCELASAAYYLDVKPLVNLTSRIIASKISGKTTEELLESLWDVQLGGESNISDAVLRTARGRLRSRLLRQASPGAASSNGGPGDAPPAPPAEDTRTVDELLSFIDGEKNKSAAASEAKREKRKAKRQQKKSTAQSPQPDEDAHEQPLAQRGDASSNQNCGQASAHMPSEPIGSTSSRVRLKNGGSQSDHFNDKLSVMAQEVVWADDSEADDDLAPEQREALDREIEEFRRRLEGSQRPGGFSPISQGQGAFSGR